MMTEDIYVDEENGKTENNWDSFMNALDMFSDDFMEDGRRQDDEQERETL